MGPKRNRSSLLRGITVLLGLGLCGYAISDHPLYGGEPGFGATQALILAMGALLVASAVLPTAWNARVLLVYAVALFSLGVAELGAELILSPLHRSCFDVDERLIFSFRPNCRSVYQRSAANGGERVHHRINSQGFRGEELGPAGSATRVIVYGDSFIHAAYSPDDETLSRQLEAALSERLGDDVEVINGGISSFGPDQLSLKMEDELPQLEPDLVILAIFAGNDYGDLLRNKLFRLGDDGELVHNDWVLAPSIRTSFELNRRGSILKRAARSALARFRKTETPYSSLGLDDGADTDPDLALVEFWLGKAEDEYDEFVLEHNDVVTNTHVDYYSADLSLRPQSDSARYKVQLMNAVLQRVKATTDEAGVPLVLLVITHPMDVCEEYDTGRVDTTRFPDYRRRNLVAPVESWARDADAHVVSLFDAYRERDACQLYYQGGNDHWNADGQKLAAKMLADYVLREIPLGTKSGN